MKKYPSPTLLASLLPLPLPLLVQAEIKGVKSGDQILDEARSRVTNIHTADLKDRLMKDAEVILVDIRTPGEISAMGGHHRLTQ